VSNQTTICREGHLHRPNKKASPLIPHRGDFQVLFLRANEPLLTLIVSFEAALRVIWTMVSSSWRTLTLPIWVILIMQTKPGTGKAFYAMNCMANLRQLRNLMLKVELWLKAYRLEVPFDRAPIF